MKIGVLALQGAFIEHVAVFHRLGVEVVEVRLPGQLEGLDGLIIPGGESTTILKLMHSFGIFSPLKENDQQRFSGLGDLRRNDLFGQESI